MTNAPQELSEQGVSIWLDDLSRDFISSGQLAQLIAERQVVGVTTNPTIFAAALASGTDSGYREQLLELAAAGADVEQAVFDITTRDVRDACDLFAPVFERTGGVDGRVSIEVDPRLANDTQGTVAAAKALWAAIDRPNALIKIPATPAGLVAITEVIAAGISVNVTLIFALERYRAVMNAYLSGLEQARANGVDLAGIHSVASFFISRVDAEVDARLTALGTPEALDRRGKAALANAQLAFQAFTETFDTPRWAVLAGAGAHPQRPLWASTGVKNKDYPDTLYVTELVARGTVNTMPGGTLTALADHGVITGDTISGTFDAAHDLLDELERLGVSYREVTEL
ncbi:MAG: transaldolase, partial [Angustibacter sp.]